MRCLTSHWGGRVTPAIIETMKLENRAADAEKLVTLYQGEMSWLEEALDNLFDFLVDNGKRA